MRRRKRDLGGQVAAKRLLAKVESARRAGNDNALNDALTDLANCYRDRKQWDLESDPSTGLVQVTYSGSRKVDGTEVAVLAVTATIESKTRYKTALFNNPVADGDANETFTLEVQAEGELLWRLDTDHLYALEMSGEALVSIDTRKIEGSGSTPVDYQAVLDMSGTWGAAFTVD